MNQNFESLTKFIVFLAVPLVVYGVLFNHIYYKHYGITITQYIDLSEAILLFIPELIKISFLIIYAIIIYFFVAKTNYNNHVIANISRKDIYSIFIAYFIVLITFLMLWIFNVVANSSGVRILMLMGLIFFFPFLTNTIFSNLSKITKSPIANVYRDFFYVSLVLCGFVVNSALQKIERNARPNIDPNFKIILNDNSVREGDGNLLLLGKTKNFVFLYNVSQKTSEVLKVEGIKSLNFFLKDE